MPNGKILTKIILIIFALLIGGFLVQTGIYYYKIKKGLITQEEFEKKFTSAKNLPTATSALKTDEILSKTAPSFGTATPKLTIVEFGNFACPYSQEVAPTARELMVKNKDKIKFIYRTFPLDDIYENSTYLSMAGMCANEQKMFWPMHDKLFYSPKADPAALAKQAGLDENKFNSCISKEKYTADIQKDFDDGYKNGVTGTPTFFFIKAGEESAPIKVHGAIPKDTFEKMVSELLK